MNCRRHYGRLRGVGPARSLLIILLAALVGGCATLGPGQISEGRTLYNLAVQRTSDEQLLLNLVRLKYRDTPMFLDVSSVSSQFVFNTSATASASLPQSAPNTFGFLGSATREERPTVTYAPLHGEDFVKRLLAPVSLETVTLLSHSGWRADRVLRLTVQRLNGVRNAPRASGPTPDERPVFEDFVKASKLFWQLRIADRFHLGYESHEGQSVLVLKFVPEAVNDPDVQALFKLLRLSPQEARFRVTTDVTASDPRSIGVATRSLLGVMFYLSQAVEVPPEHVAANMVTVTRTASGEVFDWNEVTGDLLRVRVSQSRPDASAVKVFYRGHWFYVADSDLDSKSTFSLLGQLFALQAGGVKSIGPVLTLPIGR